MLKAVTGEVIDYKSDDKKKDAKAGYLYPAGHFRSIALIHGAVVIAVAKLRYPLQPDFAKAANAFAKPGILRRTSLLPRLQAGSMGM